MSISLAGRPRHLRLPPQDEPGVLPGNVLHPLLPRLRTLHRYVQVPPTFKRLSCGMHPGKNSRLKLSFHKRYYSRSNPPPSLPQILSLSWRLLMMLKVFRTSSLIMVVIASSANTTTPTSSSMIATIPYLHIARTPLWQRSATNSENC